MKRFSLGIGVLVLVFTGGALWFASSGSFAPPPVSAREEPVSPKKKTTGIPQQLSVRPSAETVERSKLFVHVSSGGRSIAHASVEISENDFHQDSETDEHGDCVFADLPPHRIKVMASNAGQVGVEYANIKGAVDQNVQVELGLVGKVSGIVRDDSGRAIPEARVSFWLRERINDPKQPGDTKDRSLFFKLLGQDEVQVNASGRYSFADLRPGLYTVRAIAEGFADTPIERVRVDPGSTKTLDFVLVPGAQVSGTVVDDRGNALDGVRVDLRRSELENPLALFDAPRLDAVTHDQGKFYIAKVPDGSYRISATQKEADGDLRKTELPVQIVNHQKLNLKIQFEGSASISGTVADAQGSPIDHARVSAYFRGDDQRDSIAIVRVRTTDEHGKFNFPFLPAGQFELDAEKVGLGQTKDATIVESGAQDVRLVMSADATLSGRVLDSSGSPMKVFVLNQKEVRDENGRFSVPIKRTKKMRLVFKGGMHATAFRDVDVRQGENTVVPDVVLAEGTVFSGSVVEFAAGSPVEKAHVYVGATLKEALRSEQHLAMGKPEYLVTEQDGRFTAEIPNEKVTAVVIHPDFVAEQLELSPDQNGKIIYLKKGARIYGSIRDSAGRGISGAIVMSVGPTQVSAMSDEAGEYELKGLLEGTYHVQVLGLNTKLPFAFPSKEAIVAGTGAVQVDLREPLGGVRLKVRLLGNAAEESICVLVQGDVDELNTAGKKPIIPILPASRKGIFQFNHLDPGAYTAMVVHGTKEAPILEHHLIAVGAAEDQAVEIALLK